ncbi:MAG: hypothetical protein KatS3mg102_2117 [Planctomycetota bacterium]|nr:MAG: hypothetical protein KatS3mg102_2117 [Planctomycetota bacterium]
MTGAALEEVRAGRCPQHGVPPERGRGRALVALVLAVLGALAFRYACFAVMTALAVWNEARPAPHRLRDLVLDLVPYVAWVDRYNYVLWLVAYVPGAVALLCARPRRFIRYMIAGGLVSLLRGLTIPLTGLGPARGGDGNAGLDPGTQLHAIGELLDPFGVFVRDAAHIYLTKDLFFSGHTASTFLLLLYAWPLRWLRWPVLVLHVLVVASVFLSHLHYTIDVVGAYAIAYAVFVLREGRPRAGLRERDLGPRWAEVGRAASARRLGGGAP